MMKKLTVQDAINAVNGKWLGTSEDLEKRIVSVEIDSRKITESSLFVAIPGERVDGHKFIDQVLEKGAACAISEIEEGFQNKAVILVDDTKKALRDLAEFYRSILNVKVIGITGSVGKTSTKEMIATVLSEKYSVQKTAGNFNNEIGLPLTVFSIEEKHEIAVLEMGISDFGEMSRLAMIARPDIMVITNIGQCHLENLGTRDGILKAKTECFEYLNDGAEVVLNGNDDKLGTIEAVHGKKPYFFGIMDSAPENQKTYAYATDVSVLGLAGSKCVMHMASEVQKEVCEEITIPVTGGHVANNAVAAATVGLLLSMTAEEILSGIKKAEAMSGRGKVIDTGKYLLVDDCYNANPVSMKAELDLLETSPGRRVALLGDMFELGEEEAKLHYEVGSYAINKCDVLICIGALSKNMKEGADEANVSKKVDIFYFETKKDFLSCKDNILREGDTILLKASHGMEFTELLTLL